MKIGFGAYVLAVGVVFAIAVLSGACALALTVLAPQEGTERYTALAALFMETWKMAVVAMFGLIAGSGLK
jgi:hypothetical protein